MSNSVEKDVLAADDRRRAALVANDVAALERVLAPELVHTHATGKTEHRAEYIEAVGKSRGRWRAVDRSEESVFFRGDIAWIHGRQRMRIFSEDRGERSLDNRFLSVWMRDGSEWRMAAFLTVPIRGS